MNRARLRCLRRAVPRWGALALALLLVPAPAAAQDPDALVKIKTAYLYNFMKFVRWPTKPAPEADAAPAANAPLLLCVLKDPDLADFAGAALRDKKVGEQPVRVAAVAGEGDLDGCGLLYVAAHQKLPEAPAGLLTVGEGRAFTEAGGMIGFTVVQDRVRFVVNLKALKQGQLSADAQLLTVALEVQQ